MCPASSVRPAGASLPPSPSREVATLGGGCFWCTEAVFSELEGVESVMPGYSGGTVPSPSYEEVCDGETGHAEVVQVVFDPRVISYEDLLRIFFTVHDPTTPNRQGNDTGTQYRSIILCHSPEQRASAERIMKEVEREQIWDAPLVTQVEPFMAFFPAEEYHRNYYRRNPGQGYCRAIIAPKVAKFRKHHFQRLKRSVTNP
ncbi:MAG: peptide-methionine (S)-S-oxide reductase MsrA [Euryarchaeota archaeon]|nr:peptide-methionine (S)-S-oxide reductase MsrA [Euryarchaeota archaeon]MDE1835664.1 peptide-methionine (S)-S-oxide reductase MsrA [Euryarchaeota archaeon]MDE1879012.1 peptide-methionine (S)-S-oxide reductase MsrA [Euryarchaeota archaeon]MDE2043714.1 peptide-methionine (S)-S-oxide reductase MsrA [Thermoplasmata archaeon]